MGKPHEVNLNEPPSALTRIHFDTDLDFSFSTIQNIHRIELPEPIVVTAVYDDSILQELKVLSDESK